MKELLDRQGVQDCFGISKRTLERRSAEGTGPAEIYIGRKVYYERSEVVRWIREHYRDNVAPEALINHIEESRLETVVRRVIREELQELVDGKGRSR